jgi:hypothetical protein
MPSCQQERYTVEERGHLTLSGNGKQKRIEAMIGQILG